jgi:hypothetical protein
MCAVYVLSKIINVITDHYYLKFNEFISSVDIRVAYNMFIFSVVMACCLRDVFKNEHISRFVIVKKQRYDSRNRVIYMAVT